MDKPACNAGRSAAVCFTLGVVLTAIFKIREMTMLMLVGLALRTFGFAFILHLGVDFAIDSKKYIFCNKL